MAKKGSKDGKASARSGDDWSGDFDAKEFAAEHGDSDDQNGGRLPSSRFKGDARGSGATGRGGDPGGPDSKAGSKGPKGSGDPGGPLATAEDDPFSSLDAEDENGKPEGEGKVSMQVEPHEDGSGHKVHFHDDVHADVPGDADYQHHVTEHSKHYAGYLINKDTDPDKAEAHRHAANLHARIGNALHAGGDTEPRRQQAAERAAELEAMGGLPLDEQSPGEGSEDEYDPDVPTGFGSDDWEDGADVAFPGIDEKSPRETQAGSGQPAKPDKVRNIPGRDSAISAQRRIAGKPAKKLTLGGAKKSQTITMKKGRVQITW